MEAMVDNDPVVRKMAVPLLLALYKEANSSDLRYASKSSTGAGSVVMFKYGTCNQDVIEMIVFNSDNYRTMSRTTQKEPARWYCCTNTGRLQLLPFSSNLQQDF